MTKRTVLLIFTIAIALTTGIGYAQLPGIALSPVATGFAAPVYIASAGDGSGRLFVVEQGGTIRILVNGTALPVPLLDITSRVLSGGERGLLNITFPPQFALKRYFYVNYTRIPDGATVIARYRLTIDPNVADPASEEVLLVIDQPFANHNGGMMAFGPDGFLYIGMGDGGSAGDPNNFAQNIAPLPGNRHLLGKLLRIDVEGGAVPYAIPATNPLLGGVRSEIWARGLRNPWKFSFDRLTGDLYVGDVGQERVEEVNFRRAGARGGDNYGWNIFEGTLCFNPPAACVRPLRYVPPVAQYSHTLGCSVTGGYVYRGNEFPMLQGVYFFGDFCSGRIWGLRRIATGFERSFLTDTPLSISSFGEGEDGSVYLADYATGTISKLVATVTVLTPNGGQVLPSGSQQTIQWSTAAGITRVNVAFSVNNGAAWQLIRANVTGTSLLWNVPQVSSTTCRIRVAGFDASGRLVGTDRSDSTFTIIPTP